VYVLQIRYIWLTELIYVVHEASLYGLYRHYIEATRSQYMWFETYICRCVKTLQSLVTVVQIGNLDDKDDAKKTAGMQPHEASVLVVRAPLTQSNPEARPLGRAIQSVLL
jgi:hypothetical protein